MQWENLVAVLDLERERETDRQTDRQRGRDTVTDRQRKREVVFV